MNILITGAAGFIGFHLIKKLSDLEYNVLGIDSINDYYDVNLKYDRLKEVGFSKTLVNSNEIVQSHIYKNLSFLKLDIIDNKTLNVLFEQKSFTHVVHLAAQAGVRHSINNPSTYIQSNLVGFGNVLEVCRHYNIEHLLFASSSSVYGNSNEIPFSEKHNVDKPLSLYAATKKSNELMAHTYSHLYNLQVTGLRFFTVYGPWGRPDMAPMLFAKAITNNEPINVFNDGDMLRDFTYIDDIVLGIVKCIGHENKKSPAYEIFNIGNSKPINLMSFIDLMEKELGFPVKKNMLPMQLGDVKVTYADTSNIENAIGYSPSTTLEEGLKLFVKWYKKYYQID